MADHYIIDLEEQNEILQKALQEIVKECDNTNETHENIWRIANSALQECGLDIANVREKTLTNNEELEMKNNVAVCCANCKRDYYKDFHRICKHCYIGSKFVAK